MKGLAVVYPDDIDYAICNHDVFAALSTKPTGSQDEWGKDHRYYVIGCILPTMRLTPRTRRIAIESYLAGMELLSDGSSVVPDLWNWKDIWGVMHDYIFALHHECRADADGHVWTLMEANAAYREGWIASGRPLRGWLWWCGLTAGSWVVWYRR